MDRTVTGRRTCSSRLLTRVLRSSWVGLLAIALAVAQPRPIFKSDPVPPSLLERIRHTTWHPGCPVAPEDLRELTISYVDYENMPRVGVLLVNKDLAPETLRIFQDLLQRGFMIERITPIEDF